MKKFLIIAGIAVAALIVLVFATKFMMNKQEKSLSPEEQITFKDGELNIQVFYNRPFKKGRTIFGGLVPYGKVWRTGANEATTIETNRDLSFDGKKLRKGKYSIWTIPDEETWTIIFNGEYGQWGIGPSGEANRDPHRDVLSTSVHAVQSQREFEQFTISFEKVGEEAEMVFIWDKTLVAVPFSY
ncbi:MAG TPA: DUF2911 domain-containing protein [Chryseolinea sp.]|nr:DUF2911 domain-containing protein [Chryseolinea sp.]